MGGYQSYVIFEYSLMIGKLTVLLLLIANS